MVLFRVFFLSDCAINRIQQMHVSARDLQHVIVFTVDVSVASSKYAVPDSTTQLYVYTTTSTRS